MFRYINDIIIKASSVSTVNYFKELINDGPIKFFTCISTALSSAVSTFFVPIWLPIVAVGILMIIDMILGIRVSLSNGERIQSRKFWSTVKKLCFSSLMISCGHLVDEYILTSIDAHLVEGFAGLVAGVELWSMVENLQTLDPTGPWKNSASSLKEKARST